MELGGMRIKEHLRASPPDMPLVSVITVVRNSEQTIEETILSVLNQTYTNIEYIIIDGASTDNTVNIIKKYEGRINFWISEPDKGIYDAMNKGIDHASGEWIVILNSDDFFEPFACKKMIDEINADGGSHDVYCGIMRVIGGDRKPLYILGSTIEYIYQQSLAHQTCFVSRKVYKNERYSIEYKSAADYEFFSRLKAKNYKFKFVEIILVNFRLGGRSGTSFGRYEAYKVKWKYKYISFMKYALFSVYHLLSILFKKALR